MTRRRWWWVGASIVLLAAAGLGFLGRTLEGTLRAPVNNYLRDRTLGFLDAQSPTGLTITVPVLDLSLVRRRLVLSDVRIRYDQKIGERYVRFSAETPSIVLSGLDLTDMIWRRSFHLSGVRIQSPRFTLADDEPVVPDSLVKAPTYADSVRAFLPAPDSVLYGVVAAWLPEDVRAGRIENVAVDDATIVSSIRRGKALTTDSTGDMSLEIRGLELDSARHRVFEFGTLSFGTLIHATPGRGDSLIVIGGSITVAATDTAYVVEMLRTAPEGHGHAFRAHGIRRSQVKNSLTVDSLHYAPGESDSAFFHGARRRLSRTRIEAEHVVVLGLVQKDIRQYRLTPRSIRVGSLDVDVLSDKRPPAGAASAKELWPHRLASLDWVTGADSVVLDSGHVRYADLLPGRAQPASIDFSQLKVVVLNLTNDSLRSGAAHPVLVEGSARVFEVGPLSVKMQVLVQRGGLDARVEGRLGAMPLPAINQFLLVAEGTKITGGRLSEANFWFEARGGSSHGQFDAAYEGLSVQLVDPVTGKQNLGKQFKTFIAGFIVHRSSRPGKAGTMESVPIFYPIRPTDTFWAICWRSVRSGLLKVVK